MTAKLDNSSDTPAAYDFQHPSRLSRRQVRLIDHVHGGLAKRLSISLAGLVTDFVDVGVAAVDEMPWSEFLASVPSPCATFTFSAEPLEGTGIVNIDPGLAFGFIERLFGGKGDPLDSERELTSIEQKVIGKVLAVVLKDIEFAWNPFGKIGVVPTGFASSPEFIPAPGINESVVTVGLGIKTDSLEGQITLAYPYLMFEPVFRRLVKPAHIQPRHEPATDRAEAVLKQVRMPVVARLAPTRVSIRHLVRLQEGDVLMLDNHVSDDVAVMVGERNAFIGRPGELHGRLAVKVKSVVKAGGV
jgi:flagellar motor switch protein FliM